MKIFLDTANLDLIKQYHAWGLVDGVTTNPSLVAKEGGVDFETRIKEICAVVKGPVSAEVLSLEAEAMVTEGKKLATWADNVIIKLPATTAGLQACKALTEADIQVNMTLIFNPLQAWLAAKAGAAFVSPFVGRLDDIGDDGIGIVQEIVQQFAEYNFDTQVLAASIRHSHHVLQSLEVGADVVTIPPQLLDKLISHPLTDRGLEQFLNDWKQSS